MSRDELRDRVAMYAARMRPDEWERAKRSRLVGIMYGVVPQAFEVADSMIAAGLIRDPEPHDSSTEPHEMADSGREDER